MNRFAGAILAAVLVIGGGTLALAATGGSSNPTGNAAVTQYVQTPPVTPPVTPEQKTSTKKHKTKQPDEGGVKDINCPPSDPSAECDSNGVNNANGGGNGGGDGSGPRFVADHLETASTGPSGGEGGLPFTGLDVLVLAGFGLVLILIGLGQKRLFGRRSAK